MILIRSFPESFAWKLKLAPLPRPNREGGFHQMSLPITKNVTFEKVLVLANVLTFCNGSPISSRVVTLRHDISELRWSYTTNLGSKLSRNIILFICNQPEASRRPTEREIPNVLKICTRVEFQCTSEAEFIDTALKYNTFILSWPPVKSELTTLKTHWDRVFWS